MFCRVIPPDTVYSSGPYFFLFYCMFMYDSLHGSFAYCLHGTSRMNACTVRHSDSIAEPLGCRSFTSFYDGAENMAPFVRHTGRPMKS
jgi:hypothetical protein